MLQVPYELPYCSGVEKLTFAEQNRVCYSKKMKTTILAKIYKTNFSVSAK